MCFIFLYQIRLFDFNYFSNTNLFQVWHTELNFRTFLASVDSTPSSNWCFDLKSDTVYKELKMWWCGRGDEEDAESWWWWWWWWNECDDDDEDDDDDDDGDDDNIGITITMMFQKHSLWRIFDEKYYLPDLSRERSVSWMRWWGCWTRLPGRRLTGPVSRRVRSPEKMADKPDVDTRNRMWKSENKRQRELNVKVKNSWQIMRVAIYSCEIGSYKRIASFEVTWSISVLRESCLACPAPSRCSIVYIAASNVWNIQVSK